MATQITHIVAVDKLFNEQFNQYSRKDFYIGTTFPDIRYLGDVDRNKTHVYDLTLADVLAEDNSFAAGLKFHCLLDLVREDFVRKQGIYNLFSTKEKNKYAIPKLFEDELFYDKVTNWEKIVHYYDDILPEEREYSVPDSSIKKWHVSLKNYLGQPPSDNSRLKHGLDLGLSRQTIEAFNNGVDRLRSNTRAVEIEEEFYASLEGLIENRK